MKAPAEGHRLNLIQLNDLRKALGVASAPRFVFMGKLLADDSKTLASYGVADGLIEAALVPAFKEPATFVSEHSGSDQQRAVQPLTLLAGELFNLQSGDDRDYSVEIDPREVDEDTLSTLWELGFNRISLGVQDVNPEVQKAVNRIQPRDMTESVLNEARRIGFRSINLDLIYGLPYQTPESFAETLESVIEMSPDRLSVFSYAHLPDRFYPQTRIQADTLPSPQQKLTILHNTINRLLEAGYEYIGMDHFAKPDDSLAVAQREGRLHRNFQGYTTHSDCDLVSLGVSAIGQTDDAYFQNNHDLPSWEASIDAGQLAIIRGVGLTRDDRIRRWVIGQLICQFRLDRKQFAEQWNEDFDRYFADEMNRLKPMIQDELIADCGSLLQVQPAGRLLIRAICQIFDLYRKEGASQRFSRII